MDNYLSSQFSWGDFLTIAVVLIALYFLLQFLHQLLERFQLMGNFQKRLKKWIYHLLVFYEPLVILILSSVFVLINPLFHGLLLGLLLLIGFSHVKNYMSGRIVQFNNSIDIGKNLSTNGLHGIISKIERLGLKVSTHKGLFFISYSQLLEQGYLVESGEEIGGLYHLKIVPTEESDDKEKTNHILQLMDLLATAPYLDWNHQPKLVPSNEASRHINAHIIIKEESHLQDLMQLMEEWGYQCKTIKK